MHGSEWLHTKIFWNLIYILLSCQAQDSSITETGLKTEEKFDIELYGENQSKKRTTLGFFLIQKFPFKVMHIFWELKDHFCWNLTVFWKKSSW